MDKTVILNQADVLETDYPVVIGEGELAIVELANKMEQGKEYHDTKNIWFKQDNKIIKNSVRPLIGNLDQLSFPDKDLFYKYGCITDRVYVATGRGCPYRCPYCHNHQLKKIYEETGCNYVRRRSVASVIEELEIYKLKYRIKSVHFYDDTFNLNKEWVLGFFYKDLVLRVPKLLIPRNSYWEL